ncbi:hypothetical protein [Curtobacterium sp. MCBD17_023]|uniref:hypothetical protein n=1 Tax=Curtobacterium sp. MCBD17_023 TaxID=2175657 RepID=UPI000D9CDC5C|nr:hypothetical protein [Curtobacterium sp. MCBD17_023]PYY50068.1 hypothetical protein DEI84_05180 [Curtobacterium sp. MCBD17_023]
MTTVRNDALRRIADPRRVIVVLEHPWTLRVTLIVFVVVGAFLSVAVHMPVVDGVGHVPYAGTIAPDEGRHIANILFYAGRSWTAGPIITDAAPHLLTMGEIERFPSYVYYYVMSFPVKPLIDLGAPYTVIVVMLRAVNVVIGALGLVVIHRLFRVMGFSASIGALAVIVVALTGRYEWQSAGVTYDTPANTLFFLCLYWCARMIRSSDRHWGHLVRAVTFGIAAIIVKYTFVPFVIVALVVAVVLVMQRDGLQAYAHPVRRLGAAFRLRPVVSSLWALFLAVTAAIMIERTGGNLLRYGQFNPACVKVHTHQQCLSFDIYRRNYMAERAHDVAILHGTPPDQFDLFRFIGDWVSSYFQTMFFYRGRDTEWQVVTGVQVVGGVVLIIAVVAMLLTMRTLLRTRAFVWGTVVTSTYLVAMFFFNLRTFLRLDNQYAFAGRYILPVYPLLVAFAIVSVIALWRTLPPGWRRALALPAVVIAVVVAATYAGPFAFAAYAHDPSWYTPLAQRVLPHFLTGVR